MLPQARADLHCHTTASDGDHPPADVVRMAKEAGLAAIAITDHDTTAAVDEALKAGLKHQIEVVPGIEAKCELNGYGAEVLGYFVDPHHKAMQEQRRDLQKRRYERIAVMVERLQRAGVKVRLEDVEELASGAPLGRPHLAAAIVRAGYAATLDEAFVKFLYRGRPAYLPIRKPSADVVIRRIRQAGGVPVLAHPGCLITCPDIEAFIRDFAEVGIEGLEVWYPYGFAGRQVRKEAKDREEFCARMERLADRLGLLKTGGSDFHSVNRLAPLGAATCPYETLIALKRRSKERR